MIIGAGGHALSVLDSINKEIYSNISFLDDKFPNKKKIINYEIIGNISSIEQYKSNFENIFIAIGNNQIRFEIFKLAKKIGFNIINIVSKSASISDSAVLGMGNIILHNSVLSYGCKIGDAVIINNSCNVDHGCILNDGVHLSPGVNLGGDVYIGRNTWVGIGTTIINNIKVGNNCLVGAGSLLLSEIKDNSKVYGNPVK